MRKGGVIKCDVSQYVPSSAKEILVYVFLTSKHADRRKPRAVYEIYTEDNSGRKYPQLMNAAFPENDFVMNSANLWLPLFNKIEFGIRIPDTWATASFESAESPRNFMNLEEAMKQYVTSAEEIFTGIFLLGYKA